PAASFGEAQATLAGGSGAALIRIEGTRSALEEKLSVLRHAFAGEDRSILDQETTASLFRGIGNGAVFAKPATDVWRLFVPQSAAHEALTASGAKFWYADCAGGALWLGLSADEATATRLRSITMTVGGYATLMRGPAKARATLPVFETETPARAEL